MCGKRRFSFADKQILLHFFGSIFFVAIFCLLIFSKLCSPFLMMVAVERWWEPLFFFNRFFVDVDLALLLK
jgi:hypothetical protein